MLKSLFSRQKAETDELLPPPPPFPSMELEEPKQSVSEDQFEDLFDEKELDLEREIKESKSPKKLSKKDLKKLSKAKAKEAKLKKREAKEKSAPKEEIYDLDKDFDFRPEPEFQGLEEFGIGDLKAEEGVKPKEIEEAEDEISSAIEGLKKQDKKSFFRGLFGKNAVQKDIEGQVPMQEVEIGDLDAIKNKINGVRNALMNLDLETAKNYYTDIMKVYNKLKPEEQAQVYNEIKDIYYERKSAEELKV